MGKKFSKGKTISAEREPIESSSERFEARKQVKKKRTFRLFLTILIFVGVFGVLAYFLAPIIGSYFNGGGDAEIGDTVVIYEPTVEIVDMDAAITGGVITERMRNYIGQIEVDFKDLGYKVIKAVVPSGAIREVDIYIEGKNGYIKTTIDRGTGVTVEDVDRMIRYLAGKGIGDFEYIDARVPERGYWK